ncbi:MAG: DUF2461 domain-containing protein [Gemmatimonadetes bacterium]|nr:DUF2461 domain-containing protein [Gemmatimonadota bacterium]
MISQPFAGFRPAALTFLRALRRNNRRDWFEANRETFEREVKAPLKAFVEDLDVRFATVAPEFVGDPKASLFRIHRDIRFSKDKSPYKTHAAFWIFHRAPGRGVGQTVDGGAGFYFHLEPGESLVAAGLWMPPRPKLQRVRDAIADDPDAWEEVVLNPAFVRRFGGLNEGDPGAVLKRLPRGYAPGHPAERWLRYNSFTVSRALSDADVQSPRLATMVMKEFTAMLPLTRWLNRALGFLPSRTR